MYCSNCGAKMDDDSVFCPECGARCEESAQTQAGAAPQEAAKTPDAPTQDGAPIAADAADGAQEAQSAVNEAQGAPQSAARQEVQNTAQQEPQAEASSTAAALAAAASRPQSGAASDSGAPANNYFAAQFARIAAGEKPKFNWAAFFLAPFNQLYHGSTQVFKKTFLPYFIVMCLLGLAGQIAASATLATFSLGALAVTGVLSLASFGVGVWGFVLCILNGKNYTKKLYDQTQGRAEAVPALKKPVIVLLGALAAWGVVLGIVSAAGAKSAADAWMDDLNGAYLEEDADWEESWEEDWDDEAYSDDTDAGEAYVDPAAGDDATVDDVYMDDAAFDVAMAYWPLYAGGYSSSGSMSGNGFDDYCLYGDESMTLGEVFTQAFESYTWEYPEEQGQGTTYIAVGTVSGETLRISFTTKVLQDDIGVDYVELVESDGTVSTADAQGAAQMMAMLYAGCHELNGTQPYSAARNMMGTWLNGDGSVELTIAPESYGGNEYSIEKQSDGLLALSILRNDGSIDMRWVELDAVGQTLWVYERGEENSPDMWAQGALVDSFSRVA